MTRRTLTITVLILLGGLLLAYLLYPAADGPHHPPAAARSIPAALPPPQRESQRLLPLSGAHNLRDLGGYRTTDGRQVKWGLLYRSDDLDELSDEDVKYLARLKLARVVDFRGDEVRAEHPNRLPPGVREVPMPIPEAGNIRAAVEKKLTGELENPDLGELLTDVNRRLVTDYAPVYRQFLADLAEQSGPTLFHCTAGKDRTGYAAAVLLLALGVPREKVMEDYLKTNEFTADYIESVLSRSEISLLSPIPTEALRPLLGVERRYLQAAFDEMEHSHGSVANYMHQALGVNNELRDQLRKRFLED